MKIIESYITEIIEKLKISQEIYRKLSEKVHFKPMRELFTSLNSERKEFLNEIEENLSIAVDSHVMSFTGAIKAEAEKLGIELDHLIIQNNYNEALSFAIKRERELVNAYDNVFNNQKISEQAKALFEKQKKKSEKNLDEMLKRHETGDFKNVNI